MDLRSWVSDNVMKLLGMSERIFVDYIIAEAQSCNTRESLREKLTELPQTAEAQRFIDNLFDRVPRKKSQKDETYLKRKREEQEAKEALAKSKSYKLILDDFSVEEPYSKKSKKSKKDKSLRKKEKLDTWESDQDDRKSKSSSSKEKSKYSESEDEYEKEEKEKIKDLKERDEFAKRLRQKDKEKTKNLVEDRSSKAESETTKRRNLADDAEARIVPINK
ncbi:unnamed protein product [Rhizophagus irregularis]|uniref:PWI domain-containing protein n=1 Tax=Rhizophagus irregularis TaxID=588596 RepID=A0A916E6R0_9GLOM|nr:unnamed protein product [Rhizophagus irregularis]